MRGKVSRNMSRFFTSSKWCLCLNFFEVKGTRLVYYEKKNDDDGNDADDHMNNLRWIKYFARNDAFEN